MSTVRRAVVLLILALAPAAALPAAHLQTGHAEASGSAVMVLASPAATGPDEGTKPLRAAAEFDGHTPRLKSTIDRALCTESGSSIPAANAADTDPSGASAAAAITLPTGPLANWWIAPIPIAVALTALPLARRSRQAD